MFKELIDLLFPEVCISCATILLNGERHLCINCWASIPKIFIDSSCPNIIANRLKGRINLHTCYCFLKYQKFNSTQKLLYSIKYEGRKDLAVELGVKMAFELRSLGLFDYDCIIPVPLHPKKLKTRGYNQAEMLASGISQELNITMNPHLIVREKNRHSLTTKSRFARWQQSESIYKPISNDCLASKHVLIVDDVLTTGATLETVANAVLQGGAEKISIATLALAI